ncbi:hypothetical protein DSO57_1026796 [Entomophthora muscae]|uniref:Uncharacterized protein n=1 Tax=Entomophthora muscae TaxID=34485 RepID=A0ACC2SR05_9FUNG|nr:hypothetical protein DSO57_1026796 [Entomophthora muscae]
MIICQVKNLTQNGMVKELTCAYKELCLCAPSDMTFDNPATHLMYYNTLKLHVMRHVNLAQIITKTVLTTGAVSPSVIPFATTFSGPLPPPIQEPTLPEITSPPIEEDIANLPIIPTVLNLRNDPCLVAYPLGTPDLEQVMAVALGLARDGASPCL